MSSCRLDAGRQDEVIPNAGREMAGADRAKLRHGIGAGRDRVGAAAPERAARGGRQGARQVALQQDAGAPQPRVEDRHGREQRFRVGVPWPGEQRAGVGDLDDAAEINDGDSSAGNSSPASVIMGSSALRNTWWRIARRSDRPLARVVRTKSWSRTSSMEERPCSILAQRHRSKNDGWLDPVSARRC